MTKRHRLFLISVVCLMFMMTATVSAKTVLNVVGHWATVPAGQFMEMAKKYSIINPDVEIRFLSAPTNSYEGVSKILLMVGGEETNPDIINAYTAVIPEMIAGGMLAPVPQTLTQKVKRFFVPQLVDGLTFKGQLYGIPTQNQTYVLGYNARIFAESGMSNPPANWNDLRNYARELTRTSGDGKVERYGLTMGGSTAEFAHEVFNLIWANGGEYIDGNGNVCLNSIPVNETVEFLADLIQQGFAAVKAPLGLGTAENAMSFLPNYRRQGLFGSPDYANVQTTTIPINKGKPVSFQYQWGMHVSQQSRHPEEAWKFIEWLTMQLNESGRTRMGEFMASLGSLPMSPQDMKAIPDYKDQFFSGFLASLNIARGEPLLPEITRRQQEVRDSVFSVITGAAPLAGMLEQLQQRIETILRESTKPR